MRTYRMYYKDGKKRVYIGDTFDVETDEDAAKKVDEYEEHNEDGKCSKIYWDHADTINECDETGKIIKTWNTSEEMFGDWKEEEKNWWLGKKIYYWFIRKWHNIDPWFNIKLGFERMFNGYDRRVSWNIDLSIVNLLRYSIPRFVKNMHGCPNSYAEEARKMLRGMTDEEVKKSYEKEYNSTNREVSVGIAMFKADLEDLVNNINVISYYDNHGIQDENDDNYVDPMKYPIPHMRNSEVIDYEMLSKLREEKKDEVFNYLRKHFDELWD